ncbi:MAG TPA: cyclic pyranopterin monophosphate synthase MoaC [Candidatus Methanoperedenaceae archaeon]|nr:cyclic pyranopterin monophosphate synthase MoaC [Candidatus Methanoperedenaceae archaeon]
MAERFTHIENGRARMVDISAKHEVARRALAEGTIRLRKETIEAIREGIIEKGNVLAVARVASIQAVKRTWDTLPMCHQIPITGIDIGFDIGDTAITVRVEVSSVARTGVEMEALYGASIALLTIWDMVKSAEKDGSGNYPFNEIYGLKVIAKEKGSV